jgi:hypothetical protein
VESAPDPQQAIRKSQASSEIGLRTIRVLASLEFVFVWEWKVAEARENCEGDLPRENEISFE